MIFDPFQDRLSRDIRNDLSGALVRALDSFDAGPAEEVAVRYLSTEIAPCYREYIEDRLASYRPALATMQTGPADVFWQALVLWDQQLFFEVHELLEQEWMKSGGQEKALLQAMIRAAGVYVKLEYGHKKGARKLADHALPVLVDRREYLARYFDPNRLLNALQNLELPPPRLLS